MLFDWLIQFVLSLATGYWQPVVDQLFLEAGRQTVGTVAILNSSYGSAATKNSCLEECQHVCICVSFIIKYFKVFTDNFFFQNVEICNCCAFIDQ